MKRPNKKLLAAAERCRDFQDPFDDSEANDAIYLESKHYTQTKSLPSDICESLAYDGVEVKP